MLLYVLAQADPTVPNLWQNVRGSIDTNNFRNAVYVKVAAGTVGSTSTDAGTSVAVTMGSSSSLFVLLVVYSGAQLRTDFHARNWSAFTGTSFASGFTEQLASGEVMVSVGGTNEVTTTPTITGGGTQVFTDYTSSKFLTSLYEQTSGAGTSPNPTVTWSPSSNNTYAHIDVLVLQPTGGNANPVPYSTLPGVAWGKTHGRVLKGRQTSALDDASVA